MVSDRNTASISFWQKASNFITLQLSDSIDAAATKQDWETVKAILKVGGNPDELSSSDYTALYSAIVYRKYEMMILLLEAKANPNLVAKEKKRPTSTLEPPLNIAMAQGKLSAIKLLLFNGAQPDIKNEYGKTLIESTCWRDSPEGQTEKAKVVNIFAEAKQFMNCKAKASTFENTKNLIAAALNYHEAGVILEKMTQDNEAAVQNYFARQALKMYIQAQECIEKSTYGSDGNQESEEIISAIPEKIAALKKELGLPSSNYSPTHSALSESKQTELPFWRKISTSSNESDENQPLIQSSQATKIKKKTQ